MSAAKVYDFEYDRADQLTAATLKTTDPTPTVLKRYVYAYDPAGNRTSEQIDNGVVSASHNNMNQTTSTQPGGMLRLAGTTNEAANVTIAGQQAQILPGNRFQGETPVGSGTTSVPVVATDGSGNQRTYTYNVSVTGSTKTLTYDPNGNLLTDGLRTYTWDALDQLIAIDQGTHRSEFTYDGEGHRIRLVEKENSVVTADRRLVWFGDSIAEERDAGGTATRRYFDGGVQQGGSNLFVAEDHLGSVRELTDATGATRARYDLDPYGRRTKTSGDLDTDLGFTSTAAHAATSLSLAVFRAYDPDRARWLNEDPISLEGGLNLYAYVRANPVNLVDPSGLRDGKTGWSPANYEPNALASVGFILNATTLGHIFDLWNFSGDRSGFFYRAMDSYCEEEKERAQEILAAITLVGARGRGGRTIGGGLPRFPNVREHAGRHSNLGWRQYHLRAAAHMGTGRPFTVRHDGVFKTVYITRTGVDSFTFTSTCRGGRMILTHIENVNLQYLQNKGITLPSGF